MKYLTFKSTKYPDNAIVIGERKNGTYFLPSVVNIIDSDDNIFYSIEEIEQMLKDKLEMIVPTK